MPRQSKKGERVHVEAVDPIVVKVQETLEENLTYFIDNIAGLVRRYDLLLGKSLGQNKGTASEIATLANTTVLGSESGMGGEQSTSTAGMEKTESSTTASTSAATAASGGKEDAAPIARQVSAASKLPTSPLLKRAASPNLTGDMFPLTGSSSSSSGGGLQASAEKKEEAGAGEKKNAGPTAAAAVANKKAAALEKKGGKKAKVRVVEVKFPDNTEIIRQLKLLKRESYELGATMDGIHDWVALAVPTISESDNDGVEIMGAVIEQVASLTETVRSVYAAESKYLEERAELEKAMLKLPESETMKLSIEAHDNDTWDEVDRGWRTLIRICLLLYSILTKNMAVLKEPRKEHASSANMFM